MKTWERKIAPAGFFLAGVLFFVAAIIPAFKGRPLNPAFIPVGVVFAVLGIVTWRKVHRSGSLPPE
jgi:hypothetical protein